MSLEEEVQEVLGPVVQRCLDSIEEGESGRSSVFSMGGASADGNRSNRKMAHDDEAAEEDDANELLDAGLASKKLKLDESSSSETTPSNQPKQNLPQMQFDDDRDRMLERKHKNLQKQMVMVEEENRDLQKKNFDMHGQLQKLHIELEDLRAKQRDF